MFEIKVFPDAEKLARGVAEFFIGTGNEAISNRGLFTVALAGGSTPIVSFETLSEEPFISRIDWAKVHVFWGDERCVPPTDKECNFLMASQFLLDNTPIPGINIYRMEGELDPEQAAKRYKKKLEEFFGTEPQFDLILLGMGDDGHTASLFPGTAAVFDDKNWVVANYVQKKDAWRLTLTPKIINQSRNIAFVVSGESKSKVLKNVLEGKYQPETLPSQIIQPVDGNLFWYIDEPAGRLLEQKHQQA